MARIAFGELSPRVSAKTIDAVPVPDDAEDDDDVLADVGLRDLAQDGRSTGRAMRQTRPVDFGLTRQRDGHEPAAVGVERGARALRQRADGGRVGERRRREHGRRGDCRKGGLERCEKESVHAVTFAEVAPGSCERA